MKDNPITFGIDDSAFNIKSGFKTTQLIGVVCQGIRMVNVLKTEIVIDGNDATEKIIDLIRQYEKHIQYVFTHTITFGGFNIVDLDYIYNEVKKPIVAINDRRVNLDSVVDALIKKFPENYKEKIKYISNAGNLYQNTIQTAGGSTKVYFHAKGIEIDEVTLLIRKSSIDSKLPECLRLAHLIGKLF
ncbi:MAG: DUF99 family protein [Candidatus Hermodarchaeota archaeon]